MEIRTVGDLKKVLSNFDDNTRIILIGEYGLGDDITRVITMENMVYAEGETITETANKVCAIDTGTYLHEIEDVGDFSMWMTKNDAENFGLTD